MQAEPTFEDADVEYNTRARRNIARRPDRAESLLQTVEGAVRDTTGMSLFHTLTLGSIAASIALFLSGRKAAGIFVGLWPPTLQALKAIADERTGVTVRIGRED